MSNVRRPSQPAPIPLPMILFLVATLVLLGCLAAWAMADNGPRGRIDADDGDPYIVTPEAPAPLPQPVSDTYKLALVLDLPPLNRDQSYWLGKARVVARCPLCIGVDKPPLPRLADDSNAMTAWLALLWTESRFDPWAESEIGCFGLGQLCFALHTPDTEAFPEQNLYESAAEFARLLDGSADINEAISSYKGQTTDDTKWQADLVWSVVRVGGSR